MSRCPRGDTLHTHTAVDFLRWRRLSAVDVGAVRDADNPYQDLVIMDGVDDRGAGPAGPTGSRPTGAARACRRGAVLLPMRRSNPGSASWFGATVVRLVLR